jgi:hypothetical protein
MQKLEEITNSKKTRIYIQIKKLPDTKQDIFGVKRTCGNPILNNISESHFNYTSCSIQSNLIVQPSKKKVDY